MCGLDGLATIVSYFTAREVVAAIKDKKLQASFGSSGNATGSHLVGVSMTSNNVHGILCCDGGPTFAPTNSATCCNSNTYNAALALCLQNATKNLASCNLVDY